MIILWAKLALMLVIILIASQIFTNAIEYFANKIGISAGATGSIFAAVATALPETFVPVLALVAGTSNTSANHEISVGAILGAPLMLATLSLFLMAWSVVRQRGITGKLFPEQTGLKRDMNFFLVAYGFAALAMYLPHEPFYLRGGIGVTLIFIYTIYIVSTFKASKNLVSDGHGVTVDGPLMLTRIGFKQSTSTILIQLILSFALFIIGAQGFIDYVNDISSMLNVSVLLMSLLIIPIATELPEKVNSILWVRKNKDTLAFGNITGAMVFQGTLLPALGILATPWQPNKIVEMGIFTTLLAAIWLRVISIKKGLSILAFLINGALYILYLYMVL